MGNIDVWINIFKGLGLGVLGGKGKDIPVQSAVRDRFIPTG